MTKRSSAPISADARSLPAAAYTSAAFFEAEMALVERIDRWVMERVPEPLRPH